MILFGLLLAAYHSKEIIANCNTVNVGAHKAEK